MDSHWQSLILSMHVATVERKNSLLTGRNLQQNRAQCERPSATTAFQQEAIFGRVWESQANTPLPKTPSLITSFCRIGNRDPGARSKITGYKKMQVIREMGTLCAPRDVKTSITCYKCNAYICKRNAPACIYSLTFA
ncbi:hypothetical protein XENORESO_019011 [Xenotaenia resolanae]|uniref:Uncharacterized protein n=1 Tax=Xenotaenia resolanae TaxID=208358 RepID=A0ABV0WS94_9TELE